MADTSIKLSGTYDSIEAYSILEEMRGMSDDFDNVRDEAVAAVTSAQNYAGNASASAVNAATSEDNASTYAGNASASATLAENSATAAGVSETNAGNSATAAYNSEVAAAASAAAAAQFGVVGMVIAYAGSTSPSGWLLCDGSAVSRETYAALFAVIGTTYGTGDGSTTFNVPNLVDKFVEGSATSGTVKGAGLPNIQGLLAVGVLGASTWDVRTATGAFSTPSATSAQRLKSPGLETRTASGQIGFDASNSNSIYGNSTTVQPPALTMRYIIKY